MTVTAGLRDRSTLGSGTAYEAFPGMTLLGGTLHLVYPRGTGHGPNMVTMYQTSRNQGTDWSSAVAVATPAGSDVNVDAQIIALSSGRLLLGYSRQSAGGSTCLDVRVRFSDDQGATWSSDYVIPDTFSGQPMVSSQAVELPDGTILLPGYGESGGHWFAVLWKSTDGGLTFPTQVTIAASGSRDYLEPQIRLLSSGNLVALLRSSHTWRCVSTDGGATWSVPTDVLAAGAGRPDFVEIYPGTLLLFIRSGSSTMSWTTSTDEGATWAALAEVDVGETRPEMYGAPVVVSPGHVVVVYSLENSGSVAQLYLRHYFGGFASDPLGLGWITAGNSPVYMSGGNLTAAGNAYIGTRLAFVRKAPSTGLDY